MLYFFCQAFEWRGEYPLSKHTTHIYFILVISRVVIIFHGVPRTCEPDVTNYIVVLVRREMINQSLKAKSLQKSIFKFCDCPHDCEDDDDSLPPPCLSKQARLN